MSKRPNGPSLANKMWQPGIHTIDAFQLNPGEVYTEALIAYEDFTHKSTETPVALRYESQFSLDGGATWRLLTRVTDHSVLETAVRLDDDKNPILTNRGGSYIPETYKIIGVTNTNPCVLLLEEGPLIFNGDTINIENVTGTVELNGLTVTVLSVNFNMVTINVDSTNFGVFTGGGVTKFTNRMYKAEFEIDQAVKLGLKIELSDIPFHLEYNVKDIIKGTNTTLVMELPHNFDIGETIYLNHCEGMVEINGVERQVLDDITKELVMITGQQYSIVNKIGNDLVINVNSEGFSDYTGGGSIRY